MNQTFKVGDKVYCPYIGTEIYKLSENVGGSYTLKIDLEFDSKTFTQEGKYHSSNLSPSIFHATKENKKALEQLYSTEFEEPLSFLDHHLSLGSKVLCLICREEERKLPNKIWELDNNNQVIDVIFSKKDNTYFVQHNTSLRWYYIYPISVDGKGNITYLN